MSKIHLHKLDKIHNNVPGDYYHTSIQKNLLQKFWHMQRFITITKLLNNITATQILDVGCHGGLLTAEIAKKYPEAKIFGIDLSERAIKYAQKKYPAIRFLVARGEKISFPTSHFDLVTCFEVLEHVPKPSVILKEIKRVLKARGNVLLLVPNENILFKIIWFFWSRFGRGRVWQCAHVQQFDEESLSKLLKKNGFKIMTIKKFILGMLIAVHAIKRD